MDSIGSEWIFIEKYSFVLVTFFFFNIKLKHFLYFLFLSNNNNNNKTILKFKILLKSIYQKKLCFSCARDERYKSFVSRDENNAKHERSVFFFFSLKFNPYVPCSCVVSKLIPRALHGSKAITISVISVE